MESAWAEDVACRSFEGGALTVSRSLLLAVRSSEAEAGDGPGLAELVERVLVLLLLAVAYGATRLTAVEVAARVERRVGGMAEDCGVAAVANYRSSALLKACRCGCDALSEFHAVGCKSQIASSIHVVVPRLSYSSPSVSFRSRKLGRFSLESTCRCQDVTLVQQTKNTMKQERPKMT